MMAQQHLTQDGLAAALQTSQPTVARWLRGAKPRRSAALALAEFFRVPLDELLNDAAPLPFETALEQIKQASTKAANAYPDNPAAAQHAFEALQYERMWQREKKETAQWLRAQAQSWLKRANELDPPKK